MLSIIVVNFKNPALLRLCLKSLGRTVDSKLDYETLVVDISSEIETRNVVLEEFPNAKLLPFKNNIGYTKGVNEGIKASSGDYLLVLNPDIVPLKNSIEMLLGYMKKHKDVGLAGPQLLNFDGTPQQSCFGFYNAITIGYRRVGYLPFKKWVLKKFLLDGKSLSDVRTVDWLMGSALMVRRDAIDKVGLMDEKFFLYFSDVDWAKRFWENGYKVVYYPLSKIYHYHRRVSKRNAWIVDVFINRQSRQHIKDGFRYLYKWGTLKSSNSIINEYA
jgi:GT2 family glycosyltransferase